jgi:hypothetical protein
VPEAIIFVSRDDSNRRSKFNKRTSLGERKFDTTRRLFSCEWESGDGDWSGMTLVTLPQSGSIIDLDSLSFVIRIQSKSGGRGIRIGLGHSELQIITPDDARRFLEELRDSKQVDVENLLKWIRLASTSVRPPAEPRRPATSPQPESVGT